MMADLSETITVTVEAVGMDEIEATLARIKELTDAYSQSEDDEA